MQDEKKEKRHSETEILVNSQAFPPPRCSKNPQYPVHFGKPTAGVSILITSKRRADVLARLFQRCPVDLHEIESLLAVRRDRRSPLSLEWKSRIEIFSDRPRPLVREQPRPATFFSARPPDRWVERILPLGHPR